MKEIKRITLKAIVLATIIFATSGCCGIDHPDDNCGEDTSARKVLLLYSAGFNSLRQYLLDDINDLKKGWLPEDGCNDDVLLVYTHTPEYSGAYSRPTTPYLIRLYKDASANTVCDTLITYPKETISSSAMQLNEVLSYVKDNFQAGSYGMIFSSHATGYLPSGYYTNPNGYVYEEPGMRNSKTAWVPAPVPYIEPDFDPSLPMVKSVGQDQVISTGQKYSYEMELNDFAEAIPMKLDYILFDACLMGGIETAYELRGKCDAVGFSQAEVLAEGLDYKTITKRLLEKDVPDPKGACIDYFMQYDLQSGVYRSATISFIDCNRLDPLADFCFNFFSSHREALSKINPENVQRFYRSGKHWFYDLESIVINAGASEAELSSLSAALQECVIYKGHTPEFMNEFRIDTFSGFSMYLPCSGGSELDKFYRNLQWNIDTRLVE